MASKKYSFVFLASLGVAAIATAMVYRYINASTARNRIATTSVVVAARDVAEGAAIKESDLRVEQWPEPVVPENAFESTVRVSGRVARVAIYTGEAIVPGRLAPEGVTPGLEARITPGKRAMGVRITDVSGIAGMVQPNSRVDILLTMADGGGESAPSASLLMEDMRVLAMGSEVTRGPDGRVQPSSIATIEVTPVEAEKLAIAQSRGQIQLVLRGYAEPSKPTVKGALENVAAGAASLFRKSPAAPPARTTPRPPPARVTEPEPTPVVPIVAPPVRAPVTRAESLTIQVIRGTTKTDEKLKKDSVKPDTIRR